MCVLLSENKVEKRGCGFLVFVWCGTVGMDTGWAKPDVERVGSSGSADSVMV